MSRIRLTKKRPKPWSKRAVSDGSCIPPLKKFWIPPSPIGVRVLNWIGYSLLVLTFSSYFVGYLWIRAEMSGVLDWFGPSAFLPDVAGWLQITIWLNSIAAICIFVGVTCRLVLMSRHHRVVVQSRMQICPRCGYDLSRRPEESSCPECGQCTSRRELTRLWCRRMH